MSDQNNPSAPAAYHDIEDAADAILAGWQDPDEEQVSEDSTEATDTTEPNETEEQGELFEDDDYEDSDEELEDSEDPDEDIEDDQDEDEEAEEEIEEIEIDDDTLIDYQVDGETKQASIKDLKRLAGQEASLTRKSQEAAKSRKEAETAMEKSHLVLQRMLERAEAAYKPYADVDMLVASKTMDAEDFAALRKEAQEAETNLKFLKEEADTFYGEIKQQQEQQLQEQAQQAVKTLQEVIPDWSNDLYNSIRAYAVEQGLPQDEVNRYVNPAVLVLLNKARMFDEGKKVATVKKKKAVSPANKRVLKSKKAPPSDAQKRQVRGEEMRKKLRSSTDLEDIADALMSRWQTD